MDNKSKKLFNVLVYPGGTEIGLEVARALKPCKEVCLFSAGLSGTPADFFFGSHYNVQAVSHSEWLKELKAVVEKERITHIYPTHDDVLIPLLENQTFLGTRIISSPLQSCRVARSKSLTVQRLSGIVPTPEIFETSKSVVNFPVFLKPDVGNGSRGVSIARNLDQLNEALGANPSLIIQEFLPGQEFTVDCFSDRNDGVLYAQGRLRSRITNGIASRSSFVSNPVFYGYAKKIHEVIPFHGAWFFQLKESAGGELKIMEVATRIGGTSGLSRASGVNLPLLSLYENAGIKVVIPPSLEGVLVERTLAPVFSHSMEFNALYIDYDDTLILNCVVNSLLVKVIFQFISCNKPVVLVTRHNGDIYSSLRKYRLDALFDKVVHLQSGESKRTAIEHTKVAFVDDSFRELEDLRIHQEVTPIHVSSTELLVKNHGN